MGFGETACNEQILYKITPCKAVIISTECRVFFLENQY